MEKGSMGEGVAPGGAPSLQAIFAAALERSSLEREAFLDAACDGLPALRREVDSLLGWHARTQSTLWSQPAIVRAAAPAPKSLPPGSLVGTYRLEESIGAGGMGVIYRARDGASGEMVALKTVRAAASWAAEGIRREIRALRRLRHPGIVRILDDGTHDGMPWYAMELVDGTPWRQRVAELARAGEVAPILTLFRGLCRPLAALHAEGLTHRDLKPENVLVRGGQRPVIVDFGLVGSWSAVEGREALDAALPAGTRGYMSPEQRTGSLVDARADLYSLGCMLREAMELDPGDGRALDVPEGVAALIADLCAQEPRERIGHAAQVAMRLARLGAVDPDPAAEELRTYVYRPPFVGRRPTLERLEASILGGDDSACLHVISGESGAGKTRLASELAAAARQKGLAVTLAECPPLAAADVSTALFQAFRSVMRGFAERSRELGPGASRQLAEAAAQLAGIEPALEGLAPDAPRPSLSEEGLLSALRRALAAFAAGRPHLLLVDDLQWADALSVKALEHLLSSSLLQEVPLRIVATVRAEEISGPIAGLLARSDVRVVRLAPLSVGDVGRIVQEMLASRPPESFLGYLAGNAGGNPFFIAEYLRTAIAQSWLELDERGSWRVPDSRRGVEFALPTPSSIQELVALRLSRLDLESRLLASQAAVLGRREALGLLAAAAGDAHEESDLGELVAQDVLEVTASGEFRFLHDKIREGLLGVLAPEEALSLHRRAAEAIERLPDAERRGRLLALARHWEASGEGPRASSCYQAAAEEARAAYAHGTAVERFRSAVRLADPSSVGYAALCIQLANALERDHALEESEAVAASARAIAHARDDRAMVVRSLIVQAVATSKRGMLDETLQLLGEALPLALAEGGSEDIGAIHNGIALVHHERGQAAPAEAGYRAAIDHLSRLPDPPQLCITMANLADLLQEQGLEQEAVDTLERALAIARRRGDTRTEAGILSALAGLQQERGELDAARTTVRQAVRLAKIDLDRRSYGWILYVLGSVEREAGLLGKAHTLFSRSIELLREAESHLWLAVATAGLAGVHRARGDLERAHTLATEAYARAEGFGGFDFARCILELARVELAMGRDPAHLRSRVADVAATLGAGPSSPILRHLARLDAEIRAAGTLQ